MIGGQSSASNLIAVTAIETSVSDVVAAKMTANRTARGTLGRIPLSESRRFACDESRTRPKLARSVCRRATLPKIPRNTTMSEPFISERTKESAMTPLPAWITANTSTGYTSWALTAARLRAQRATREPKVAATAGANVELSRETAFLAGRAPCPDRHGDEDHRVQRSGAPA